MSGSEERDVVRPVENSFVQQWESRLNELRAAAPDTVRAFGTLFQTLMKPGALTVREKELIALGIAIADRCEPCIHLHVDKAIHAGAVKEEVLEAAGVAVLMQGGPAFTHLPSVLDAIEASVAVGSEAQGLDAVESRR